jgi:hypothetical protein
MNNIHFRNTQCLVNQKLLKQEYYSPWNLLDTLHLGTMLKFNECITLTSIHILQKV